MVSAAASASTASLSTTTDADVYNAHADVHVPSSHEHNRRADPHAQLTSKLISNHPLSAARLASAATVPTDQRQEPSPQA